MSKTLTVGAAAFLASILCATPLSFRLSPEGMVSIAKASAETVNASARAHRRAYRRDYYGYGYYGASRYDYSRYERFSYQGFWGNYGFAYQPWWSR